MRPAAIAPSQSCDSMHSIQSMPNVRLGQVATTPVATTKYGVHGNDSQSAVNGDDLNRPSETRTGSDVVEDKLFPDNTEEDVNCDDKVVANGDAKRPGNDVDSEAGQKGGVNGGEGGDCEGETTTQQTLIDLSPVVELKQTPPSQDHIDVIIGDKLIDLSPVAESNSDSPCLEATTEAGDQLVDLSAVTESQQQSTACLETNIDSVEGGTTSVMTVADWNPLLPPSGTSTPAEMAPVCDVCVNGEVNDAGSCDVEKKCSDSREEETGKGEEQVGNGTQSTPGEVEETSCAVAGNGTNDEQVSPSGGDSGIEASSCKVTGAVVDCTAERNDKKCTNSAPGSEIHTYDKMDFG